MGQLILRSPAPSPVARFARGTTHLHGEIPMTQETSGDAPPPTRQLNEDWLAVVVGLALVALALLGVIPTGLVP